jgi:hypothetical protein
MNASEIFVVSSGAALVVFVLWFYFGPKGSKKS